MSSEHAAPKSDKPWIVCTFTSVCLSSLRVLKGVFFASNRLERLHPCSSLGQLYVFVTIHTRGHLFIISLVHQFLYLTSPAAKEADHHGAHHTAHSHAPTVTHDGDGNTSHSEVIDEVVVWTFLSVFLAQLHVEITLESDR